MRTILTLLFLLIFLGPFSLILLPLEWLIGKINQDHADRVQACIVKYAFVIVGWLSGARLTVIGRENIPKDRPVLYISNHRGFFDIVLGDPLTVGICGFVAKKELLKVPVLRIWMKRIYCQFLDRTNARDGMRMIKACTASIKAGKSIWIFPEGTRSQTDELLPFKEGSFKIAELSGCPVLPVTITHTDDILENHFPWLKRTAVTIEFGKPIETRDLDRAAKKALPAKTQEIIAGTYIKNK